MHFELLGDEKKSMTRLIFTSPRHLGALSLYTSLLVHICLLYRLFFKASLPASSETLFTMPANLHKYTLAKLTRDATSSGLLAQFHLEIGKAGFRGHV